jgi:2-oxoglutarate dehydrogenase E2 component (dihydrolipoamide succinyltransferase)
VVNSSWSDEGLIQHRQINIGMATSLGEEGLIVPVIKNAADLSLVGIARSVNELADRARNKQLQPDEVTGSTFTITNHGVSGSLFAMPIINQPQSAILGVGKLQKRVMVLEDYLGYDTIAIRPMVYLTLTFDHRVLDGAIADYFLSKVVETLENWT